MASRKERKEKVLKNIQDIACNEGEEVKAAEKIKAAEFVFKYDNEEKPSEGASDIRGVMIVDDVPDDGGN